MPHYTKISGKAHENFYCLLVNRSVDLLLVIHADDELTMFSNQLYLFVINQGHSQAYNFDIELII
jgi:hypothetical protein